jgi:uncharacterized protein YxeA
MKNLLLVLVLVVAGVIGLGFYLKWFNLSSDNGDGKSHITLTVDEDKVKADETKAKESIQGVGQKAKEKVGASADKPRGEGSN